MPATAPSELLCELDSAIRFLNAAVRYQEDGLSPDNAKRVGGYFFSANGCIMDALNNLGNCVDLCSRHEKTIGSETSASARNTFVEVMTELRRIALIQSKAYSTGAGTFGPGEAIPTLSRLMSDTVAARQSLQEVRTMLAGEDRRQE